MATKAEPKSKITFRECVEGIHQGLNVVSGFDFPDFSTNYTISKNLELSTRIFKSFEKFRISLERKYVLFSPKTGNIELEKLVDDVARVIYKSMADREAYEKEMNDFYDSLVFENENFKDSSFRKIKLSVLKKYNEETAKYNAEQKAPEGKDGKKEVKPLINASIMAAMLPVIEEDVTI